MKDRMYLFDQLCVLFDKTKEMIVPQQFKKVKENKEVVMKEKEGWKKSTMHTTIAYFFKKCNKSMECEKIEIDIMDLVKTLKLKTQSMKRN